MPQRVGTVLPAKQQPVVKPKKNSPKKKKLRLRFWSRERVAPAVAPEITRNMTAQEDRDGELERALKEDCLEEETAMDTDQSPEPQQQPGKPAISLFV